MLDVVTSANVACGFHAGDPRGLLRVCEQAAERGVVDRRPGRLPRPRRVRAPVHRPRPRRPAGRRGLPDRGAAGHLRAPPARRSATSSRTARSTTPSSTTRPRPPPWSRRSAGSTPRCRCWACPGRCCWRSPQAAGLPTVTEAFADRAYTPARHAGPAQRAGCRAARSRRRWPPGRCAWSSPARSRRSDGTAGHGRRRGRSASTATARAPCRWPPPSGPASRPPGSTLRPFVAVDG